MADQLILSEADLTCTICVDIFRDPVTLKCSHSFCQECLQTYWKDLEVLPCPVCRKECSTEEPTLSLAFKSLCESLRHLKPSLGESQICSLHEEKFKLFCYEEKLPICVVCHVSKEHKDHKCSPVEEAAQDLKARLKTGVEKLEENLLILTKAQKDNEEVASSIKHHPKDPIRNQYENFSGDNSKSRIGYLQSSSHNVHFLQGQVQTIEQQVRQEFQKFIQFLQTEEAKWIASLHEKEKEKCRPVEEILSKLKHEISSISETIEIMKKEIDEEDITLLKNYNVSHKRIQHTPVAARVAARGEDITQPGSLFTVWAQMQHLIEEPPVILDPITSSSRLQLLNTGTSIKYSDYPVWLLDNPERLRTGVLGSRGFTSGLHCWDVEVGDCDKWTIGVVAENVNRKRLLNQEPKSKFCVIQLNDDVYTAGVTRQKHIEVYGHPYIIRVWLDYDKGLVNFCDPLKNYTLHSFNHKFNVKVFPYFSSGDSSSPLWLFPGQKSVSQLYCLFQQLVSRLNTGT